MHSLNACRAGFRTNTTFFSRLLSASLFVACGAALPDSAVCQGLSWTLLSPTVMEGRSKHAAAFDSSRNALVMFGGQTENSVTNETWELRNGQWTLREPAHAPSPMAGHDMAYHAGQNLVYLSGRGELWSWDGSDWTARGTTPRMGGALVYDTRLGRLIFAADQLWSYDGRNWQSIAGSATSPQIGAGKAAFDPTRGVLVAATQSSNPFELDIREWNGSAWKLITLRNYGRTNHKVRTHNGQVRIGPGYTFGCSYEDSILAWNGQTATSVGQARRLDYAFGPAGPIAGVRPVYTGTTCPSYLVWDDKSPEPQDGFAMAYDSRRKRLITGFGFPKSSNGPPTPYLRSWSGGDWSAVPTGPSARYLTSMTYDSARDEVVVFGGGPSGLNDTWVLENGTTWKRQTPSVSPPPRLAHAAVYDPKSKRVIVYGGTNNWSSMWTDTWAWDGATKTWTQLSNQGPAATYSKMTVDTKRDRIVLAATDNSIWEWDGARWARVASLPNAIVMDLAYDPVRERSSIFGVSTAGIWVYDWDGTSLVSRKTERELLPTVHQAVYSADYGGILCYTGGLNLWALQSGEPVLCGDVQTISLSGGGAQVIDVDAGANHAQKLYLMLGSMSGNSPGFRVGSVQIPLNIDAYTDLTLALPNNGLIHTGTFAALDANGLGRMRLTIPPGLLSPNLVGARMHHAVVVFSNAVVETATNDIVVELVR